ncbi:NAD-dependent epimerase/dehydratase family protein [Pedobacter rhodius]|uniref:NAD(P)-dependent oxidoreductase n=1 Tax=Pedobacter rhodius TaxID=3004098 RepID=A0ABT4KVI4_9SPHI|nr:NAD(P)-dependent oxidoreductase [Pedobacter sp. SJ11]MCZ4222939.1 NAD(P)-dependent oxidoreductase [Pedobacter sp. SJ11]
MKKRILITGATGFIGFHLIEAALANDMEVYANIRKSSNTDHLTGFPINYVELDFESIYALKKNIEEYKYHYIVHAAGVTKAKSLDDYHKFNAIYSRNLAIAAATSFHEIEKFVFVSSLAALGPLSVQHAVLKDSSSAHPVTYYGKSKALAEAYLSSVKNLPLLIFRPTAVYGPRERDLLIILKTIKRGFEVYIGQKDQQLSFIYVKDLAELIIGSLKSALKYKTYNVSDGNIYSRSALGTFAGKIMRKKTFRLNLPLPVVNRIAWCLEQALKVFDRMPTLNVDKIQELTGPNWACDIENIKKDLGFMPRYQLEHGLNETIKWYHKNNWL